MIQQDIVFGWLKKEQNIVDCLIGQRICYFFWVKISHFTNKDGGALPNNLCSELMVQQSGTTVCPVPT